MAGPESPMLKSARQTSEARAYGFNKSGTMAGQVGADAAQRERNAQKFRPVSRPVSTHSTGGGGGGVRTSHGGGGFSLFPVLFGGGIWTGLILWIFGPAPLLWVWSGIVALASLVAYWAIDRMIEAGIVLLGWAPDIGGYLVVVALCIVALAVVVYFTRTTILIASGLWLAAIGIMAFLLMRWHDPAAEIYWLGVVAWSFPVYAPLISLLALPLTYEWFRRNSFNENLSRAFSYSGVLMLIFAMGMICLGFGIGQPGIMIPGLIYIAIGAALLAGLMTTSALATHFLSAARND